MRARFLREADHIARLDQPNIVAVYDRGDQDGQLWIAMQYIDGSDAAAALREGPLPAARAVRIITETAKALDYARAADVLHRDIKPANIMLTRPTGGQPERVLLADFGIAKGLDDRIGITATGMFHGGLQYAAPSNSTPRKDSVAQKGPRLRVVATRLRLAAARVKAVRVSAGHGDSLRLMVRVRGHMR